MSKGCENIVNRLRSKGVYTYGDRELQSTFVYIKSNHLIELNTLNSLGEYWSPWKSVDENYIKIHNHRDDNIINTIFQFIFQVKVNF